MNKSRPFFYYLLVVVTITAMLGGLSLSAAVPLTAANAQPGMQQSVIVQSQSADLAAALVEKHGGQVTSRLEIIDGVGAQLSAGALIALRAEPGITRVTENAQTELTEFAFDKPSKNPSTDFPDVSGADLAWEQGALGQGIGVAVIDTGIDDKHPGFKKGINGKKRDMVVAWKDFVDGKKKPVDPNGHGTHIAGIIANAEKGADGEFNGMAPAVNLIGVRVLDKTGAGDYEKVIQGIQWVLENKDRYNIRVMNLSLHSLVQSPYWADPLDQAVMRAWAEGITVVVAAGNNGPNAMTVAVPGNTPYVITVGAFTDNYTPADWNDDYLADFSAAGPTLDGFVKPDLLAPGAHITSTMMPGSYIARTHDHNWRDGKYFSMAGTSQAAGVVSGAVAQMLSVQPELTPDQVKYRLMVTSLPWINTEQTDVLYSVWQQGAGRLNAYDAAFATDIQGTANNGLDITADLNGTQHFEGFSYFDEATGTFRLHGFEAETGGYGSWAGGYGSWAGGYGSWAGGYGVWAGQLVDPVFINNFVNGVGPNLATSSATVEWTEEH